MLYDKSTALLLTVRPTTMTLIFHTPSPHPRATSLSGHVHVLQCRRCLNPLSPNLFPDPEPALIFRWNIALKMRSKLWPPDKVCRADSWRDARLEPVSFDPCLIIYTSLTGETSLLRLLITERALSSQSLAFSGREGRHARNQPLRNGC